MVGNARRQRSKSNGVDKKNNSSHWCKDDYVCLLCRNKKFWYSRNKYPEYEFKCTKCGNKDDKLIEKLR